MWSMITVAALFLLDIVIGTVLFGCIGLAAYGIWLFTNWLSSQGIPDDPMSYFRDFVLPLCSHSSQMCWAI